MLSKIILIISGTLCFVSSFKLNARSLSEQGYEEILKSYSFIGDLSTYPAEPQLSEEVFWRYPVSLPFIEFAPEFPDDQPDWEKYYPSTNGVGRAYEHLNGGRQAFLEGNYEKARKMWLGGRARYSSSFKAHRRNDYFLASSFLMLAKASWLDPSQGPQVEDARENLIHANTFFSWAYGRKKEIEDVLVEERTPWALYNQASIYYSYSKWRGAYGAITRGLNYLRSTGRKEYRPQFHTMLAELHIRNRTYLDALQNLDRALRLDPSPALAARVFARVGDIYFDLNNYPLAEEMYALAIRIDKQRNQVRPEQYILRGESLFWLGQYAQAQRMFEYGLRTMASSLADNSKVSDDIQAMASLRTADAYLALKDFENAKIAYFRHEQEFRSHLTSRVAVLRRACLELPFYQGNNVEHARKVLEDLKKEVESIPLAGQQLAWTCELASYSQRERSAELLERIRPFAEVYPRSKLLKELVPVVVDIQASRLEEFLGESKWYEAINFFEQNKDRLFKKMKPEWKSGLFKAYMSTQSFDLAKAFYAPGYEDELLDKQPLELALFIAHMRRKYSKEAKWKTLRKELATKLDSGNFQVEPSPENKLTYTQLLQLEPIEDLANLSWMKRLSLGWTKAQEELICSHVFPTYKASYQIRSSSEFTEYSRLLDDHLEFLLAEDRDCALSMLSFEQVLAESNLDELALKYLAREELEVDQQTAPLIFNLAESLSSNGSSRLARQLWTKIVEEASDGVPEKDYSRLRMAPPQTQMDALWNN